MRRHVLERNRRIFEMMRGGMRPAQIRAETGLPHSTLKHVLALLRGEGESVIVYSHEERNAHILRLAADGLSQVTIAARLELSVGTVAGVLRRARLDREEAAAEIERQKRRQKRRHRHTPEALRERRNARILEMLKAGAGQREIARKLGLTANTVIGWIDRQRRTGRLPQRIALVAAKPVKRRRGRVASPPLAFINGSRIDELLAQADRLLAEV